VEHQEQAERRVLRVLQVLVERRVHQVHQEAQVQVVHQERLEQVVLQEQVKFTKQHQQQHIH
jgi:hypothetical protein